MDVARKAVSAVIQQANAKIAIVIIKSVELIRTPQLVRLSL